MNRTRSVRRSMPILEVSEPRSTLCCSERPRMAQDSYGLLHLRGEYTNLQYGINDVL